MKRFNPKYYIIYPRKVIDELTPPEGWSLYPGNLGDALKELLNVKAIIGSEIKLIWNSGHRWSIIQDYNITPEDLDDFLKADCSLLSFETAALRNRVLKQLKKMGLKTEVASVDCYRDVLLQQAQYHRHGCFSEERSEAVELKLYFTVEAFFSKDDPFGMKEGEKSHIFYCNSLTDLAKTMRCISPKGYRTGSSGKYSRMFKKYGPTVDLNNFFGVKSYTVSKVKGALPELRELEYTATHGFTHVLKVAKDSIPGA